MANVSIQPGQTPAVQATDSNELVVKVPSTPAKADAPAGPGTAQDAVAAARRGGAATVTGLVAGNEASPKPQAAASRPSWGFWNHHDKPRVAFFGSSTTAGAGASSPDRRFTTLLSMYMGWEEINAGKGGSLLSNARSGQAGVPPSALQRWQTAVVDKHPDKIMLMYGANDLHSMVPMTTFKPALTELLNDLVPTVGANNLLVVTPQPILKSGDRTPYDTALKEGAAAAGVSVIDPGQIISAADMPEYAYDHAHLNDLGHAALASYVAGKLTDMGWGQPVEAAKGGNAVSGTVAPMAAGRMLIDNTHPLTDGEVKQIEARFTGAGTAVVGVVRPNGTGGYNLIYRTDKTPVQKGIETFDVPRWRVLEGDRLAVWTDGADVGGADTRHRKAAYSIPTSADHPMRDVNWLESERVSSEIAIRAVDPPKTK